MIRPDWIQRLESRSLLRWEWAFLTGAVVFVFLYDYYPMLVRIGQLRQDFQEAAVQANSLSTGERHLQETEARQELSRRREAFRQLKAALQSVEEDAVRDPSLPAVTLAMEDLAEETGIELTLVRPGEPRRIGSYQLVPVELGFRGAFAPLVRFVAAAEDAPQWLAVNRLTIDATPGRPEKNIGLTLDVLFVRPGDDMPADEGQP